MRGKTLTNEKAESVIEARRARLDHKLLEADFEWAGHGPDWDESKADDVAAQLNALKDELLERGEKLDVNSFDRKACVTLHHALALPPELAAQEGFWRWLAVEKLPTIVEERARRRNAEWSHLRNYGIYSSIVDNRLAILWFRADMVYDPEADDPYELAKTLAHEDFWNSCIIRHRYGWSPGLARTLVRFQYRDPSSQKPFIDSSNHARGIRELYKRLRRLHSTVAFEYLSYDELWRILEEKTIDLRRA